MSRRERAPELPPAGVPEAVKIRIDSDRCSGHGQCCVVAPDLFVDDEAGYGRSVGDSEVSAERLDQAQRAVTSCPEQVISLDHGSGRASRGPRISIEDPGVQPELVRGELLVRARAANQNRRNEVGKCPRFKS